MVLSGQIPLWWVIASVQWFGRWATWLWALFHVISVSIGEPFFSIHQMGAHRRESSTRTRPSPDIKSANDFPASRPLVKKKSLVYNFTQPAVCCYTVDIDHNSTLEKRPRRRFPSLSPLWIISLTTQMNVLDVDYTSWFQTSSLLNWKKYLGHASHLAYGTLLPQLGLGWKYETIRPILKPKDTQN